MRSSRGAEEGTDRPLFPLAEPSALAEPSQPGEPSPLAEPSPPGEPSRHADPLAMSLTPDRSAGGPAERRPAVRFVDVVHRYGKHVALDHLHLEAARGETLALLGPNGAGKSTTISLLLGLLRPQEGIVEVLGVTPRRAMAEGLLGAMLQQGSNSGLPPGVRVGAVLDVVRRLYRRPAPLDLVVDRTGIAPLLGRQTHRLSGGEAQRVRFAVAIAGDPEVLFLDEPTAAMDVEARRTLWTVIRQLGQRGRTIVFATHHFDEVEHADRVAVVHHGRVVADGPGATLKAAVASRRVRFVVERRPDDRVLDTLEGVTDVALRGATVTLDSLDADATVRDLVQRGVEFKDLEVTGAHLEEAFLKLTGGDAPSSGASR